MIWFCFQKKYVVHQTNGISADYPESGEEMQVTVVVAVNSIKTLGFLKKGLMVQSTK